MDSCTQSLANRHICVLTAITDTSLNPPDDTGTGANFRSMKMSYNRLWKLLIDKNMKKYDLRKVAGVSSSSLAKLGRGENVTTDVILKICVALDCRVEDIMEIINDETLTSER